jgi:hypothetical protein
MLKRLLLTFGLLAGAALAPQAARADCPFVPDNVAQTPGTLACYVVGTFTATPSGTQNVNLIKVGGTAYALGQGLKAASMSVTLASDQGSLPVTEASGASILTQITNAAASLVSILTQLQKQTFNGAFLEVQAFQNSAGLFTPTKCDKNLTSAAIVTATTTNLVPAVGGQFLYVCSVAIVSTAANVSDQAQFENGTGGTCGTGTNAIAAPQTINTSANGVTAVPPAFQQPDPWLTTPVSNEFCVVTTGTTIAIKVWVSYAQHT